MAKVGTAAAHKRPLSTSASQSVQNKKQKNSSGNKSGDDVADEQANKESDIDDEEGDEVSEVDQFSGGSTSDSDSGSDSGSDDLPSSKSIPRRMQQPTSASYSKSESESGSGSESDQEEPARVAPQKSKDARMKDFWEAKNKSNAASATTSVVAPVVPVALASPVAPMALPAPTVPTVPVAPPATAVTTVVAATVAHLQDMVAPVQQRLTKWLGDRAEEPTASAANGTTTQIAANCALLSSGTSAVQIMAAALSIIEQLVRIDDERVGGTTGKELVLSASAHAHLKGMISNSAEFSRVWAKDITSALERSKNLSADLERVNDQGRRMLGALPHAINILSGGDKPDD